MFTAVAAERKPALTPPIAEPLDSDSLFEVVHGIRAELPPMSTYAHVIALRLYLALNEYLQHQPVGTALHETLLVIDELADVRRRPHVAFLGADRWPVATEVPEDGDLVIIPTIAIEVVSPHDLMRDVLHKTHQYLSQGVLEVWLIVPEERVVYRYRSPHDVQILAGDAIIDGEPLLPGFRLPTTELLRRTIAIGSAANGG